MLISYIAYLKRLGCAHHRALPPRKSNNLNIRRINLGKAGDHRLSDIALEGERCSISVKGSAETGSYPFSITHVVVRWDI